MANKSNRINGVSREMKKLLAVAEAAGWEVGRTKKGHLRLIPADPTLPIIVTGSTPSDHRAIRNFKSQLRRAGLPV